MEYTVIALFAMRVQYLICDRSVSCRSLVCDIIRLLRSPFDPPGALLMIPDPCFLPPETTLCLAGRFRTPPHYLIIGSAADYYQYNFVKKPMMSIKFTVWSLSMTGCFAWSTNLRLVQMEVKEPVLH